MERIDGYGSLAHTCHPTQRDPKCAACVVQRSRIMQSWRPDRLTVDMMDGMAAPFCWKCADWHEPEDVCSMTDADG